MSIDGDSGQLHLNRFPDAVRRKLKLRAVETGVTFRQLVIHVLAEWVETDREGRSAKAEKGVSDGLEF